MNEKREQLLSNHFSSSPETKVDDFENRWGIDGIKINHEQKHDR